MGLWTWSLKKKEISVGEDGVKERRKSLKKKEISVGELKMEKKERRKRRK
jgi:hypothetical protein